LPTKITKWACIGVVIGAVFFWSPESSYAVRLQFFVCGTASLIAFQAARSEKHLWAIAFAGLALLFNPFVTVPFSYGVFRWLNLLCLAMFVVSIRFLHRAPRVPMPSVTH